MVNNYTYQEENNLIKDGDYEVIIERMEVKTLPTGTEKLQVMYRIRSDVDGQSYGNLCVFEDIWKEKDGNRFNPKRINRMLGTQKVEVGTVFESINDIIEFMVGKPLVIHLVTVFDDYWQKDVNNVSYYKSSNHKPQEFGNSVPENSDDDLPF